MYGRKRLWMRWLTGSVVAHLEVCYGSSVDVMTQLEICCGSSVDVVTHICRFGVSSGGLLWLICRYGGNGELCDENVTIHF